MAGGGPLIKTDNVDFESLGGVNRSQEIVTGAQEILGQRNGGVASENENDDMNALDVSVPHFAKDA